MSHPTGDALNAARGESPDVVVAKIDKALEMVHWLCQPEGVEGPRRWVMSIPARPDHDPDIVIASALYAAKAAIQQGGSQ